MKFEVGKTYATRSICDYDCIYRVTIVSRSASGKSVVISYHGEQSTRRIFTDYDGAEAIRPFGNYSMAAVISATPRALALAAGENVAA